jgi:hypothetical protein
MRQLLKIFGAVLTLAMSGCAAAEEPRLIYVRIAELEIDPGLSGRMSRLFG